MTILQHVCHFISRLRSHAVGNISILTAHGSHRGGGGKRAVPVVWQSKYVLYHITACNMLLQHPECKFSPGPFVVCHSRRAFSCCFAQFAVSLWGGNWYFIWFLVFWGIFIECEAKDRSSVIRTDSPSGTIRFKFLFCDREDVISFLFTGREQKC